SPIIGAVYALAGASNVNSGSSPYANAASLFDTTSGSNGSCGGSYLCTSVPGYDGPTGLGTPNGTTAFGGAPASAGSLAFQSTAQTLIAGTASAAINVQLLSGGGAPQPASSPVNVTLSSSSSGGTFATSTSGPWSGTLTVTVSTGNSSSPSFYYQDTRAGSPTLTAVASGYTS